MHEGDRSEKNLKLSNSGMMDESIQMVIDVISKNVKNEPLDPEKVDWNNLKYTVDYLGVKSSVDFIYPLFLTIHNRVEWYKDCEFRRSYDNKSLIEVKHDEMKVRDPDYDIIGRNVFRRESLDKQDPEKSQMILEKLSHIPCMFVAGGYALAAFTEFKERWSDIDIFAYGPDAMEHIKESVKICLEMIEGNLGVLASWLHPPIRTRYSITIPIGETIIQFILIESRSPSHILSRFDINSSCIGFELSDPTRFYTLPRFIRAFETKTNVIDPTRQSPTYIIRLIKYTRRGFCISVPGFNNDTVRMLPNILKIMLVPDRKRKIKEMKLTGLQALVASALIKQNASYIVSDSDYMSWVNSESVVDSICKFAKKTKNIEQTKLILGGQPLSFVVSDVLNEGEREFKIRYEGYYTDVQELGYLTYVPKYPEIELTKDDPQNGMIGSIHQVKTSFYGEYYDAKVISLANSE
uniref:Ankyrin repeat protein n=1 Tax=Pithovirus LCPAC403 TaxID=2506596 RepID=A0A481ZCR8_9VIRU|nr:MAG: hypothetical protein LCPAC403_00640 [Pithovirus LCPAC403]